MPIINDLRAVSDAFQEWRRLFGGRGGTLKDFEHHLREHRMAFEFGGKLWLLPTEEAALLETFRAKPVADPRRGPRRMMEQYPDGTPGYVVFITDTSEINAAVFVGLCPADARGPTDLLELVQFASPDNLSIILYADATPEMVRELHARLEKTKFGPPSSKWFWRSPMLSDVMDQLREGYEDEDEPEDFTEDDDTNTEDDGT